MLDLFMSKNKPILGVDISTTSIKILELSYATDAFCVEAYAHAVLPFGLIEGDLIQDVVALGKYIEALYAQSSCSAKQVAIAVPDSLVITKTVQMSHRLSTRDMEHLIAMEAGRSIPYPLDEVYWDFAIQGVHAHDATLCDVLLVASRKEHVQQRVEALACAGLETVLVDVVSHAVERAAYILLNTLPAVTKRTISAFVAIGPYCLQLFVFKEMNLIFSREELFGEIKLAHVVSACEKTSSTDAHSRVLLPFYDMLFLQMKRTLQFFYSSSPYDAVDQIILCGEIPSQADFARVTQESLGIPVQVANPLSSMCINPAVDLHCIKKRASSLIVACGLALGSVH